MYAIERKRIIKQYLRENGQAQVHTLSNLLAVSEVTVRRDLERLEKDGWLTRTHGGAVINNDNDDDPYNNLAKHSEVNTTHADIAKTASKVIEEGDVIALGSGPINLCLAQELISFSGLTILTNDPAIALKIAAGDGNRIVLLGGEIDRKELAAFGPIALENIKKYYFNKLFIEPDGIGKDLQLTVNSQEKASLILGAAEVTNEIIALCPSSKFGHNAFYRLDKPGLVNRIISDTKLSEEYKAHIFNSNIPLYTSVSAFEGVQ